MKKNIAQRLRIRISNGFSLIELMVVIVIIGLLTTFAIPTYNRYVERTEFMNAYNYANSIKKDVFEYAMNNGGFDANLNKAALGITDSKLAEAKIQSFVIALDGSTKANFTSTLAADVKVSSNTNTSGFKLDAVYNAGEVAWTCTPINMDSYFIPKPCLK